MVKKVYKSSLSSDYEIDLTVIYLDKDKLCNIRTDQKKIITSFLDTV